jgi:hypothetical protein
MPFKDSGIIDFGATVDVLVVALKSSVDINNHIIRFTASNIVGQTNSRSANMSGFLIGSEFTGVGGAPLGGSSIASTITLRRFQTLNDPIRVTWRVFSVSGQVEHLKIQPTSTDYDTPITIWQTGRTLSLCDSTNSTITWNGRLDSGLFAHEAYDAGGGNHYLKIKMNYITNAIVYAQVITIPVGYGTVQKLITNFIGPGADIPITTPVDVNHSYLVHSFQMIDALNQGTAADIRQGRFLDGSTIRYFSYRGYHQNVMTYIVESAIVLCQHGVLITTNANENVVFPTTIDETISEVISNGPFSKWSSFNDTTINTNYAGYGIRTTFTAAGGLTNHFDVDRGIAVGEIAEYWTVIERMDLVSNFQLKSIRRGVRRGARRGK